MSETIISDDAIKTFDDDGRLIALTGKSLSGKFGTFIDEANGLCPHELVDIYCEECSV